MNKSPEARAKRAQRAALREESKREKARQRKRDNEEFYQNEAEWHSPRGRK